MSNNISASNPKPKFFIVGAPKAGTTSLYHYLDKCNEIYMSDIKEPNYFSCEEIREQELFYEVKDVCNYNEYLSLFKGASEGQSCGEASVSYLYYPEVAKKIYDFNNTSKIIIVLREPTSRAISHYSMDYRLGLVNKTLNEIINGDDDNYFQQYIKLGLYYEQVKRYLDLFGKERVKIIIFDEMVKNPQMVYQEVLRFLDIESLVQNFDNEVHNNAIHGRFSFISFLYKQGAVRRFIVKNLPDSLKDRLKILLFSASGKNKSYEKEKYWMASYFKEDILKLQKLINQDLSDWIV